MIRATRLFSHASRLHSTRASSTQTSAIAAAAAAAASGNASSENWTTISVAIGAAGLSALGVGIAAKNCMDNNENSSSVALCEQVVSDPKIPLWRMPGQDDAEGDVQARFRTIPVSELNVPDLDGGGKSERAFTSALENRLFDTYEDGADDWEEAADDDDTTTDAIPHTTSEHGDNAVMEHFVSFSGMNTPVNIQPRMSIRHTNRKAPRDQVAHEKEQGDSDSLLATSDGSEAAEDATTPTEEENKEVILKRINTVRRNGLGQNQVYTKKMYFYQSAQVKDYMRNKFRLFALPSSEHLGKEMAYLLGTSLNCIDVGAFTDGETSVKIEDGVRGKEVFVVCTTINTNSIMELLLTVSALRRGSAKKICAVIPYYGYCRQDRKAMMKREPIAAADIAKLLEEMGIDSVICIDLHNPLLKGFFSPKTPVNHLMPGPVAAAYFYEELFGTGDDDDGADKEEKKEPKEVPKITVVAAHENQVFRANGFRNALQKLSGSDDINVALISNTKELNVHEKSDSTTLVGDVEGRKCIIVDDIISTGGTMRNAIETINNAGASEIYAWATHGVLHLPQNDAPQKIQEMDCLKYLLISNSVAIERELPSKIRKLSIAPLLAESVARALHGESISSILQTGKSEK